MAVNIYSARLGHCYLPGFHDWPFHPSEVLCPIIHALPATPRNGCMGVVRPQEPEAPQQVRELELCARSGEGRGDGRCDTNKSGTPGDLVAKVCGHYQHGS